MRNPSLLSKTSVHIWAASSCNLSSSSAWRGTSATRVRPKIPSRQLQPWSRRLLNCLRHLLVIKQPLLYPTLRIKWLSPSNRQPNKKSMCTHSRSSMIVPVTTLLMRSTTSSLTFALMTIILRMKVASMINKLAFVTILNSLTLSSKRVN